MKNKVIKIVLKPMKERKLWELLYMMKFYKNCTDAEFRYVYQLDTAFA